MDFSGGTRKFPVAQGTGQAGRTGVQPPPPLGPQFQTFLIKDAFLKEESNLVAAA